MAALLHVGLHNVGRKLRENPSFAHSDLGLERERIEIHELRKEESPHFPNCNLWPALGQVTH